MQSQRADNGERHKKIRAKGMLFCDEKVMKILKEKAD
jgi:hypothetical protein